MKQVRSVLTILLFSLLSASYMSVSAQSLFSRESHVIHAGGGFGGFGFGNCYAALPVISFSYDQGLIDNLFIGNLGVGGAVAVKHYNWDCNYGNRDWSWNRVYIGTRATYHFHFMGEEGLDLYTGVSAGVFIWTGDTDAPYNTYAPVFAPGLFGGGNYWFNEKIGVYAEVGYSLGIINTGLAINF